MKMQRYWKCALVLKTRCYWQLRWLHHPRLFIFTMLIIKFTFFPEKKAVLLLICFYGLYSRIISYVVVPQLWRQHFPHIFKILIALIIVAQKALFTVRRLPVTVSILILLSKNHASFGNRNHLFYRGTKVCKGRIYVRDCLVYVICIILYNFFIFDADH